MQSAIESGQLVIKQVEESKPAETFYLTSGTREGSAALK